MTAPVVDGRAARKAATRDAIADALLDLLSEGNLRPTAREIAGRSPDAVRGAKALINGLLHGQAERQFAEERRVIGSLIGRPNQVEAIMANFEKRAPSFSDS